MVEAIKYLTVEFPDNPVVVDFLGKYPCTATLTLGHDGELWVKVVSATQEARFLVDEVVSVPEGDEDEAVEAYHPSGLTIRFSKNGPRNWLDEIVDGSPEVDDV